MFSEVLLYIPNVIGYVRLVLAAIAFTGFLHPLWFMTFYTLSVTLDGFDGYFARRLNQCSKFGAWFDVVIDLFTRGYLWCALFRNGYLIIFLEWLTFVATHSRGENWKIPEEHFPTLVKLVMANGFKTPMGFFAVGSIHILPLWLYGYKVQVMTQVFGMSEAIQLVGLAFLFLGRCTAAVVEVFYIKEYMKHLLQLDEDKVNSK